MGFGDEIRERVKALGRQAAVFRGLKERDSHSFGQAEPPSQVGKAEIQFTVDGKPRVQSEPERDGSTRVSCWEPKATAVIFEAKTEPTFIPGNPDPRFPSVRLSDLEAQASQLAAEARVALEGHRKTSKPNQVLIFPPQGK